MLLERGASCQPKDEEGRNALDQAIDYYRHDCVREILGSKQWKDAMSNAIQG